MKTHRALPTLIALACALCAAPVAALDVTLDSGGSGSLTFTDDDMDHIIDFDVTVGGVFRAKGRVFESLGELTKAVTLTSTPPDTQAIFGKIGVGAGTATFTVTVNTSSFTATGAPLGWTASARLLQTLQVGDRHERRDGLLIAGHDEAFAKRCARDDGRAVLPQLHG